LNYPLLAVIETPHKGDLPARQSFASIEPDHVILSAVKKAEDNDDLVLRLYELFGQEARATIRLTRDVQNALETDLLENAQSPLETERNTIAILARPYEIKTVMARF
jgi:alpha-mannosidase